MKAKHLFYTLFIFLFSLTSCENEAIMFLLYYSILKEERTW